MSEYLVVYLEAMQNLPVILRTCYTVYNRL